jgi:hypothetical protein
MRRAKNVTQRVVLLLAGCMAVLTVQTSYLVAGPENPQDATQRQNLRGWWPQDYSLQRDDASGVLTLATPYYTIQHDLKKGGAISSICLTYGKAKNLLLQPMETRIKLLMKTADAQPRQQSQKIQPVFSDLNNSSPSVKHTKSGRWPIVTVESALRDANGKDSGVKVKTTYMYRWGYIKIHKEFTSKEAVKVENVCVLSMVADPSLVDYGYRPGVCELMGPSPHGWQSEEIRQWGKIRPGTHFDLPFRSRYVPRYLVLANRGIEGIEWFVSDELSQWDYQISGQSGTGYCEISPSTNPLGIALSIYPLNLSSGYELPRGGFVNFKGKYVFDYYIGVPILEGHAYNPWLNKSYRASGGKWVSEAQISKNAEDGVVTMHLHNDGDSEADGLFWRDGSYPPYPAEEMRKMEAVIANIHKYGMKTAPYFSNHELHQSTEEFKKHGQQWGRKPDDQGNLRPNYYYGAHMCLKSGWLDFLKFCVDRVLKNHDFDGVYYDWNIAMFCNNPLHTGKASTGVSAKKGLATYSQSPTGHWDIDELIELVEWTRQRVGRDGIIILHNTLVPMFATENFANYVVGMEFSYGKLSVSMPRPEELPLEWNFVAARPRAVIGYGTITPDAPRRLHKLYAITTLMTSIAPWPASDEAIELYKVLKPLGDLEQYKFEDWRNEAVRLDDPDCISAIYSRPGVAYILLANLKPQPQKIKCIINPGELPYPLSCISTGEILNRSGPTSLGVDNLTANGETITIGADDVVLLCIR